MNEPIRKSVRVRCAPHRRWERSRMVLEAGEGGRVIERAESGEEAELGRVVAWQPPELLRYSWVPGSTIGPTEVHVRFTSDGDETLVLVEPAFARFCADHTEGRA